MYWRSGIMSSSLSTEWQYVRHTPLHHSQSWRQPSQKTKWQSLSITARFSGMFRQTLQFEITVQNAFLQIFWVGCYWAPHYHLPKFDLEFYIPLHRFFFSGLSLSTATGDEALLGICLTCFHLLLPGNGPAPDTEDSLVYPVGMGSEILPLFLELLLTQHKNGKNGGCLVSISQLTSELSTASNSFINTPDRFDLCLLVSVWNSKHSHIADKKRPV